MMTIRDITEIRAIFLMAKFFAIEARAFQER
jgi:hypothetical protein